MYAQQMTHLPDPDRQHEFYDGVTIKRGIAWCIDTLVILAIALPLALLTIIGWFMVPLFVAVVGFLYRWFTLAGGSATWGMRMMAIEFRDMEGRRLDGGQALLHTAGTTLSFMIPLIQVVSVVLMFLGERGQGLTDMVLGTVALNRRL